MSVTGVLQWMEQTPTGVLARESLYGFQILAGIHIVSLTFSVGMLLWFDLRLMGIIMPGCAISNLYRRLVRWSLIGFASMFISGLMLLTGFATAAYGNTYFRIKIAALTLAGANALLYHLVTERGITKWDQGVRPPAAARTAGFISILLWVTVILAGRMMSYTMF